MAETWIDFVKEDNYCIAGSDDPKYIEQIRKLVNEHPDEVVIEHDWTNRDGELSVRCPKKWFKMIKPPKKVSDKQKEKASERFKQMWEDKKNES